MAGMSERKVVVEKHIKQMKVQQKLLLNNLETIFWDPKGFKLERQDNATFIIYLLHTIFQLPPNLKHNWEAFFPFNMSG